MAGNHLKVLGAYVVALSSLACTNGALELPNRVRTTAGALTAEEQSTLSFEEAGQWQLEIGSPAATLTQSTTSSHGQQSLSVEPTGNGYAMVKNVLKLAQDGQPFSVVGFDIWIDGSAESAQLQINAPSAGVWAQYLGWRGLAGYPQRQFTRVEWEIPVEIQQALANSNYNDLEFWIGVGGTTETTFLLDHFTLGTETVGQAITPILTCVATEGEGFVAFLGYENSSEEVVEIPVGFSNEVTPHDFVIAQPTTFQPGTHEAFFIVRFDDRGLRWRLGNGEVETQPDSTACAPIGPPREPDPNEPEKLLPEVPTNPVPSSGFVETSSNDAPLAMLRQVPRDEPMESNVQALIAEGRGNRAVEVVLVNATDRTLTFVDGEGEGAIKTQPPSVIRPGSYGTWETRDGQAFQGTGGQTTFSATGFSVTVFWDNPFVGGNDYSVALEGDDAAAFTTNIVGGTGNLATVFFILGPVTAPTTNCAPGSMQWIIDNLRAMERPLAPIDQILGFISTPAKRITGVKNWASTGCFASRVVGEVRQLAASTDGFWTIDLLLEEFEGALLTGTNKAVRVEVDPMRGIINPAWLAILANGGPPSIGDRIIVSGDVLIDHSSFLEVHPTSPMELAPPCNTFPPGSEPLYCSTVLQNIFTLEPGQQRVVMGRAQNRACFLTRVSGFLAAEESELAAAIDPATGDWVLTAVPGVGLDVHGQARCLAARVVTDEVLWSSGQPRVEVGGSGISDCYFTRVGGTWHNAGGAQLTVFVPVLLGESPGPATTGIRAGARCMADVTAALIPFILDPAPSPRVFMRPIREACFFKQIQGDFSQSPPRTVGIVPDASTGSFQWVLEGNTPGGAAAACARLDP
jgi:hypothetical protein